MARFLLLLAVPLMGFSAWAAPPPIPDHHQLRMKSGNAKCLIKRRSPRVQAWLSTLPGTAAERKAIRPVEADFTACFASWPFACASTWNHDGIRRGLIKELLQPRLADLTGRPPPGLSRVAWFPPEQALDPAAAPALLANDLGFCLARSDWPSTRALMLSEESSAEDKAALNRLVTQVGGCLPPGQKLTLDTARLRAILFETVYHATTP